MTLKKANYLIIELEDDKIYFGYDNIEQIDEFSSYILIGNLGNEVSGALYGNDAINELTNHGNNGSIESYTNRLFNIKKLIYSLALNENIESENCINYNSLRGNLKCVCYQYFCKMNENIQKKISNKTKIILIKPMMFDEKYFEYLSKNISCAFDKKNIFFIDVDIAIMNYLISKDSNLINKKITLYNFEREKLYKKNIFFNNEEVNISNEGIMVIDKIKNFSDFVFDNNNFIHDNNILRYLKIYVNININRQLNYRHSIGVGRNDYQEMNIDAPIEQFIYNINKECINEQTESDCIILFGDEFNRDVLYENDNAKFNDNFTILKGDDSRAAIKGIKKILSRNSFQYTYGIISNLEIKEDKTNISYTVFVPIVDKGQSYDEKIEFNYVLKNIANDETFDIYATKLSIEKFKNKFYSKKSNLMFMESKDGYIFEFDSKNEELFKVPLEVYDTTTESNNKSPYRMLNLEVYSDDQINKYIKLNIINTNVKS